MKKQYESPVADIVQLIPQQSLARSDDDRDRRAAGDIITNSNIQGGVNTGGRG